MKKVAIYTTTTCTYCKMAKDFFNQNKIEFAEYNVGTDLERRKEMVDKSGQLGVPVITVDAETIVGFDKGRLEELLGVAA